MNRASAVHMRLNLRTLWKRNALNLVGHGNENVNVNGEKNLGKYIMSLFWNEKSGHERCRDTSLVEKQNVDTVHKARISSVVAGYVEPILSESAMNTLRKRQ